MRTFTIENDNNNITIHASAREAEAVLDSERFASEAELASLASNWQSARLVEIWNSLPSATPVKKFTDRKTAVSRIWKAIQALGGALPATTSEQPEAEPVPSPEAEVAAPEAPHAPDVAPEEAPATNDATPTAETPTASPDEKLLRLLARTFAGLTPEQTESKWDDLKSALAARPSVTARTPVAKSEGSREGSKTSQVIEMLKREGGATLEEIMTRMGWQKHTTRALLSAGGSLTKKHGLTIASDKVGDTRTYSIKA
jgi:hypothetical protein